MKSEVEATEQQSFVLMDDTQGCTSSQGGLVPPGPKNINIGHTYVFDANGRSAATPLQTKHFSVAPLGSAVQCAFQKTFGGVVSYQDICVLWAATRSVHNLYSSVVSLHVQ